MRKIELNELKELQMEIADFVDNICKDNDIKYSLGCGTLLGAVRHGGYIPWDDDLDIMLPRSDYNKLTQVWDNRTYPFIFHCVGYGNNQGFPYGKISNPKTILDDNGNKTLGVNIDVFPIDEVIDINDYRKRHQEVMDCYLEMSYVNRSLRGSINRIIRNLFRRIQHYPNTPKRLAKRIDEIALSMNGYGGNFMFEMVAGRCYKGPFNKNSFEKTVAIKFENRIYQALEGYDDYLKSMFGDYMQLPPLEEQVSHHIFNAWWK